MLPSLELNVVRKCSLNVFLLPFYYLDFHVYIFMYSSRVLSFFADRAHSRPVILDSFLVLVHVYVIYVH